MSVIPGPVDMLDAMAVIVQKFGGTSLADPADILRCALHAVEARGGGHDVVVVVSAMGRTTDRLIEMAEQLTDRPNRRELDLLLTTGEQTSAALMTMAIHSLGAEAISFTGHHLGIITDPVHCRASIRSIDQQRIIEQLGFGRIVVAAGFQGVTEDGQLTTLGRGGSDLTAVALAASLGVSEQSGACEIYTDVEGVMTADPRVVSEARKIDVISYEEMLELASLGASVLHCRAAICAQKYGVPLHVRHSRAPAAGAPGTLIMKETKMNTDMESVAVVGCALTQDLGMVSVHGLPNSNVSGGPQAVILRHIAQAGVLIDDIVQTEADGLASISFTAERGDLATLQVAVGQAIKQLGAGRKTEQLDLAKVSAVGVGMRTHTGVAATMFNALAEAGIAIKNITTSEIKISCIVEASSGEAALRAVHHAFGLERVPHAKEPVAASHNAAPQIEVKPPQADKVMRST